MISIESHTASFIVKIWLEEEPDEEQAGLWRGHITHVESGRRRYLRSLAEIPESIMPYLKAWGVRDPALVWPAPEEAGVEEQKA